MIPHLKGREERLELPDDVLRKALVNSLHRTYRSTPKLPSKSAPMLPPKLKDF
ncbi:MAG: hypothetical protein PVG39_26130 [Desulfobacteraceae bacterium]|jgi:hypothetical protein